MTVGVVVAVVFLIANLLGDAALFFYNADEAVERRVELGDDRFRVQGTPLEDTIIEGFRGDQPVVVFAIGFGEVTIDIVHVGDPPELFQPGVPVVLEGSWTEGAPAVDDFDGLGLTMAGTSRPIECWSDTTTTIAIETNTKGASTRPNRVVRPGPTSRAA